MAEKSYLFRRNIGRWRKLVNENCHESLKCRQSAPHCKCKENTAPMHTRYTCAGMRDCKLQIQRRLGGEALPPQLRQLAFQKCTPAALAFDTPDSLLTWINDQEENDCGIDLEVTAAFCGTAQTAIKGLDERAEPQNQPHKRRRINS